MLVLTRKAGETIVIGNGIRVTVSGVTGNRVKIAIDAPRECSIRREEIANTSASRPVRRVEACPPMAAVR